MIMQYSQLKNVAIENLCFFQSFQPNTVHIQLLMLKDPSIYWPIVWGFRIHRLHLCGGVRPRNQCPGYDTKHSDFEAEIILKLLGTQNTS